LLLLSVPGITSGTNNFFFSQVVYLCLILGGMYVLQAERVGA
jgi:hypothetical protein